MNKKRSVMKKPAKKPAKKSAKKIVPATAKLVETVAERAGVSKRQARRLVSDADQRIAEALGVNALNVRRARDDVAPSEDRRDWAAEDKHDLDKEGGWEDP